MSVPAVASAVTLLAAAALPFDLPPMPRPDEGYGALWDWLWTANAQLSIPDPQVRWLFGGIAVAILLLAERQGVRTDWKLWPFLVPFWLAFGGVAFGALGGLAAAAAHVVLFPIGRVWFMLRDRQRGRAGEVQGPVTPPAPAPAATPPRRSRQELLRAALDAMRAAAEQRQGKAGGAGTPGQAEPAAAAILRALAGVLGAAAGQRPGEHPPAPQSPHAAPQLPHAPPQRHAQPPVHPHPPHPQPRGLDRPPGATGVAPGRPDFSPFRPDLSRFRRRPPRG